MGSQMRAGSTSRVLAHRWFWSTLQPAMKRQARLFLVLFVLTSLALALLLPVSHGAETELTLRGRWPAIPRGPALKVALQNGYAFVAAAEGGLVILDVRNQANPE